MADKAVSMNFSATRPLLVSLALLSFFTVPANAQSPTKDYRDWSVTCSNLKTCTAVSISGLNEMDLSKPPRGVSDKTETGWLWVEIEAGPNAKPKILYSGEYLADQPTAKDGTLRILGQNGRALANGTFVLTSHESGASQVQSADIARFISVARAGQSVVYFPGTSRTVQSFASLSGFVAALRAIEVEQGRTGTLGAWIDGGKQARERIPPAPTTPRVSAMAFAKITSRTTAPKLVMDRRKAECDDSDRLDYGGQGIESFNLGKGRILWVVPCGAGAYNMWSKFYLQTHSNRLEPYPFSSPDPATDEQDAHSLVNVSVEPETGQISAFSKGRGVGDCGSAQTYVWDGTEFVLTSWIEMTACSGLTPDFWPVRVKKDVIPTPAKAKR